MPRRPTNRIKSHGGPRRPRRQPTAFPDRARRGGCPVPGRLAVGPRALHVGRIGRLPDVGPHQLRAPGYPGPLTTDPAERENCRLVPLFWNLPQPREFHEGVAAAPYATLNMADDGWIGCGERASR